MHRRSLLKVVSGAIAIASASIVGIPGISYVIATVRSGTSSKKAIQRVIRLKDLNVGKPTELTITGRRRDAWTIYEKQAIGRIWLLRTPSAQGEESSGEVRAFSAKCPHLGCAVKLAASGKSFACPCHQAGFDLAGHRLSRQQLGHQNPSPRDLDTLECRVVSDDSGEQWVEVMYEKFQYGLTDKVSQG